MSVIDFSQLHHDLIESMKDQLLIVLFNRLGGKVSIPVSEIDETGMFNLTMSLDTEKKIFTFEVIDKQ